MSATTLASFSLLDPEYENVQPRIIPDRFVALGDVVVGIGRTEVRRIETDEIAHQSESAGRSGFATGRSSGGGRLKAMPLPCMRPGWLPPQANQRLAWEAASGLSRSSRG